LLKVIFYAKLSIEHHVSIKKPAKAGFLKALSCEIKLVSSRLENVEHTKSM